MPFIGCIIADVEKRAQNLEGEAKDASKGAAPVATVLGDLEQRSGTVGATTLKGLAGGSTWCSTREGNRVRVLCDDGTGALANGQGQQSILWQVDSDGGSAS